MPIDLQREIMEIKVCVGEINVKLDIMAEYEKRLRELESYKDRIIGVTIAVNIIVSAIVTYLVKTL